MPTLTRIAISTTSTERLSEAKNLAELLQLDFIPEPDDSRLKLYDYFFVFTPNYLGLQKTTEKFNPFYLDFLSPQLRYRCEKATLRNELLARAIGAHPKTHPNIIDATAGLGRDSLILASLGFQITMIERSPIVHALLQDALNRYPALCERITLILANAIDWLNNLAHDVKPDVIYMDPMFPERSKSALVKKEIAMLQQIIGQDTDEQELFKAAFAQAKSRVVVKRPKLAANIANRAPNFVLLGKINRFDVYVT